MNKFRILIIDDEPRWIDFAQKDLGMLDFEIVVAPDTETALACLADNRFDLVIASSRRLDVLEVIAQHYADKRVVVTTMQPTTQEARAVYRLHALNYFPKSFREGDLREEVEKLIPNSPATRR